jgi:hydrophobe/amphiphile efflux-3 (HAE3) family protein
MGERFEGLVRGAARRPGRVLAVVALLAVVGAALALLRLEPSASTDTLVGSGSEAYQATETYRERFGDHSIAILVRGAKPASLPDIVLTKNLGRLLGLEGCLSGNGNPGAALAGTPCERLNKTKPVQVVYGPGTFINSAVAEIQEQLRARYQDALAQGNSAALAARKIARAQGRSPAEARRLGAQARELKQAEFLRDLLQYNVKYGLDMRATPYLNNPDFVAPLVFDASKGAATPKARFAYLFPNDRSAAIQVRLKPDLSEDERAEAIAAVREAVRMPQWKLEAGVTYTVTGAPLVVEDLTDALSASILRLLAIALVVMAAVLAVVFRSRLRLVPLGVALGATAVLFGLMALLGLELTMASIAVLPVLLGLGVDYAIQYQARVEEEEIDGDTAGAAARATRLAVPTIATAMAATAVGFGLLLLSPVPMVRGFGALLIVGVVLAFLFALTAGTAALVVTGRRRDSTSRFAASARGAADLVDAGVERVSGWLPTGRFGRLRERVLQGALARPGRVLLIGLALALTGWVVDSQSKVESDIAELVPQDLPALRDLRVLQETTDVSGEIDVVIEGDDITRPEVVDWMRDYQSALLARFDYSPENGCGVAQLCPALSLPDLFRTDAASSSQERIRSLLDAVPPYFSQAVISADRRTANLAFGIKLMPLDEQKQVIDEMRERLDPPDGITARVAGLPVLAADANAALASPWRRLGTLAGGLLAVLLVLWVVGRRARSRGLPAWVPVVPIALATGWSALVIFALRVPLNPMSATLGALVIAISTEFSVLLSARYRQERDAGYGVEEALRRTYRSTGAAVLASGATAIAGFAVLALSDIAMLRDFGIVTVVDLSVSLLGVLAVLPAVLVLAERRAARGSPPAPAPEREPVPA